MIDGAEIGGKFSSLWSDVGTEVVVETGLAFDFGPMASSIRRLIFDALRDRVDLRVEQHHGQLEGWCSHSATASWLPCNNDDGHTIATVGTF